jgi:hypothetical protein
MQLEWLSPKLLGTADVGLPYIPEMEQSVCRLGQLVERVLDASSF